MTIKSIPSRKVTTVIKNKRANKISKREKSYVLGVITLKEGKLVLFYTNDPFSLKALLVSQDNVKKILWRSSHPFWCINEPIKPKGISLSKQHINFEYLTNNQNKIIRFPLSQVFELPEFNQAKVVFDRVAMNPILAPIANNEWESFAVFNPAALYMEGQVHLVYRAIGDSGLSNFGYATSLDGERIDKREHEPIYHDSELLESELLESELLESELLDSELLESSQLEENISEEEGNKNNLPENNKPQASVPESLSFSQQYQSGINWGGYEDPRLTLIEDTIYMTYTAFDGHSPPGVALTSISKKDFLDENWQWKKPIQISEPQQAHKNWVIFPQKINGKFAVLHSITPKVLIDYYDDLEFKNNSFIKSQHQPSGRKNMWDNRMRGVGPPPIKTQHGWLVLYHAMDTNDPDRYKIGAMLLDLNEPTKIISRSSNPLLEPDARYENDGFKAGVVYTCGAVIIGENLYVYYGGADTVVCAAFINLARLLEQMGSDQPLLMRKVLLSAPCPRETTICMKQRTENNSRYNNIQSEIKTYV